MENTNKGTSGRQSTLVEIAGLMGKCSEHER